MSKYLTVERGIPIPKSPWSKNKGKKWEISSRFEVLNKLKVGESVLVSWVNAASARGYTRTIQGKDFVSRKVIGGGGDIRIWRVA